MRGEIVLSPFRSAKLLQFSDIHKFILLNISALNY